MIYTIPRGHAQAILRRCHRAKLALARRSNNRESTPIESWNAAFESPLCKRAICVFRQIVHSVREHSKSGFPSHERVARGWLGTNTLRLRNYPRGFRQPAATCCLTISAKLFPRKLPHDLGTSSTSSSTNVSIAKAMADAKAFVEHAGLSASTCSLAVPLNAKPLVISASPAAPRRRHRAWMMIIASYHFAKSSCWR